MIEGPEGGTSVFKTAREDVALLVYPTLLVLASVVVLVGLGAYQRFSASVEEKVGDDDEAEEAREEGRAAAVRKPATSKAGTARR